MNDKDELSFKFCSLAVGDMLTYFLSVPSILTASAFIAVTQFHALLCFSVLQIFFTYLF